MKTLVIYEMIPDETQLYLIPETAMTTELLAALEAAQGSMANTTTITEAQQRANAIIGLACGPAECRWQVENEKEAARLGCGDGIIGAFNGYAVEPRALPTENADIGRVFWMGFIL